MKKKTIYLVILLLLNIIFIGTANASTLTGTWAGPVIDNIQYAEIGNQYGYINGYQRWVLTTSSASGFNPVQIKVYPTGYWGQPRPVKIESNTNMIRFQAYAGFNANTNESTIGVSTGLNASIRLEDNQQITCIPYTGGSVTSFECPIANSMQGTNVAFILFQFTPSTLGAYQFGVSDVFQMFNEEQTQQQIKDNTNEIKNKLEQNKQEQKETNKKIDEIQKSDISSDSKEAPNTNEYNDYQNAENGLFDKMEQADTSNLDVAIDGNSAKFVWDTITRFYNSNALLMNFLISILSIGIIKMALGR